MLIWFPLELLSAFELIHMLMCAIEILNIRTIILFDIVEFSTWYDLFTTHCHHQVRCMFFWRSKQINILRESLCKSGPLRFASENRFLLNFAHEYILVQK